MKWGQRPECEEEQGERGGEEEDGMTILVRRFGDRAALEKTM